MAAMAVIWAAEATLVETGWGDDIGIGSAGVGVSNGGNISGSGGRG